ncbi:MAG: VCBS repeat-containing protein [Planctomycetes bacterium]|nr:VCBS repeat-containing protein [Planctomycetota bacterium]
MASKLRRTASSSTPHRALLRAILCLGFTAPLTAQAQFDELQSRVYPPDSEVTEALRVGDVDGDGDLDVIAGMGFPGAPNRLYRSDGRGRFTDDSASSLPADADETRALALGDIDRDGDLDLFAGNFAQDRLYRNDGLGRFTEITATHFVPENITATATELADLDLDGDLDLLVASELNANRLYLNDGAGRFTLAGAAHLPSVILATRALAIGDVDADRDLDIVFGGTGQTRLYRNDGSGRFSDATAQLLPTRSDAANGIALGDLDRDGDLDLYIANGGATTQDALLLNDGTGRFREVTSAQLPSELDFARCVALGDVDGDGTLDIVLGLPPGSPAKRNVLYRNDGTGRFSDRSAQSLPLESEETRAVLLADLDRDGDLDLLCGNGQQLNGEPDRLLWNDGAGRFTHANEPALPPVYSGARAMVFGDFDANGETDVVLGHDSGVESALLLRSADGRYIDRSATHLQPTGERISAGASGDLDQDGDLDLILGATAQFSGGIWWPRRSRAYFNDGTGRFSIRDVFAFPFGLGDATAVALADIDGDHDLDLYLAQGDSRGTSPGQDHLLRNDGSGNFQYITGTHLPWNPSSSSELAFGDLDGDGDMDLVVGKDQGPSRIYRNAGDGSFVDVSATAWPAGLPPTSALALGDLDGDRDLDLLVAPYGARKRLWMNDGAGFFLEETSSRLPFDTDATMAVALGDIDGDGHLDIALASQGQDRLYRNDGTGRFTDVTAPRLPMESELARTLALIDLDRDADLDLWSSDERGSRILWNLLRHLDAPYPLRLGHEYELEVYAAYGPPRTADVALVLLSTQPGDLVLPELGWLGLSPTALLSLPWLVLPSWNARASHVIQVPRSLGGVGVSIYAQPLLVPVPAAPRFGPRVVDPIMR